MARPRVVVTRKLPEAVEARLRERFDVALNPEDPPFSRDAAGARRCGRRTGCSAPSPTRSTRGSSPPAGGAARGSSRTSGSG